MLINNEVLCTKEFLINFTNAFVHILEYGVNIEIITKNYSQFLRCNILANPTIFILSKSKTLISFWQMSFLNLYDFLFYFYPQQQLILYFYLFDYMNIKVFDWNNTKRLIQISRHYRFCFITKVLYENCFVISINHWATITPPILPFLFYKQNGIIIPIANIGLETELLNSIKLYADKETI